MSKKKAAKTGTKNVPPPTRDEACGRAKADTVVADGEHGIARTKALMRRIFRMEPGPNTSHE